MNMVPIGELVQKVEKLDPRVFETNEFTYIDIGAVSQNTKMVENPQILPCHEAPSRARQVVANNDILVSTVRPNLNAVAKVPAELDETIASTGFSVLRPIKEKLDPSYLYHWVRTQEFVGKMMMQATGQSYPAVSDRIVKSSTIPLPPFEEQKRIAGILDQADTLRRLRSRALDKLKTLGQSIFYEMFGDVVGNSKGFEQQNLTDALNFTTGKLDSNAAVVGGEFPFFTCAKEISAIDTFAFDCEALLLAGNNASADYDVKYYNGKFNAYQRTYVLTLATSELRYRFVQRSLETMLGEMKRFSKGSNTKYLTMGIFKRMSICKPSLDLQDIYIQRAEALLVETAKAERSLSKVETLFASLQHRAFRGDL